MTLSRTIPLLIAWVGLMGFSACSPKSAQSTRQAERQPSPGQLRDGVTAVADGRIEALLPVPLDAARGAARGALENYHSTKISGEESSAGGFVIHGSVIDPPKPDSIQIGLAPAGAVKTRLIIHSPADVYTRHLFHAIRHRLGLPADGRPGMKAGEV